MVADTMSVVPTLIRRGLSQGINARTQVYIIIHCDTTGEMRQDDCPHSGRSCYSRTRLFTSSSRSRTLEGRASPFILFGMGHVSGYANVHRSVTHAIPGVYWGR